MHIIFVDSYDQYRQNSLAKQAYSAPSHCNRTPHNHPFNTSYLHSAFVPLYKKSFQQVLIQLEYLSPIQVYSNVMSAI